LQTADPDLRAALNACPALKGLTYLFPVIGWDIHYHKMKRLKVSHKLGITNFYKIIPIIK